MTGETTVGCLIELLSSIGPDTRIHLTHWRVTQRRDMHEFPSSTFRTFVPDKGGSVDLELAFTGRFNPAAFSDREIPHDAPPLRQLPHRKALP